MRKQLGWASLSLLGLAVAGCEPLVLAEPYVNSLPKAAVESLHVRSVRFDTDLPSEASDEAYAATVEVIRQRAVKQIIKRPGKRYDPKSGKSEIVLHFAELKLEGDPKLPEQVTLALRGRVISSSYDVSYSGAGVRVGNVQTFNGVMPRSDRAPSAADSVANEIVNRLLSIPEKNQNTSFCQVHVDSPLCTESPFVRRGDSPSRDDAQSSGVKSTQH